MKKIIYFVRHGIYDRDSQEKRLTAWGVTQITSLGQVLLDECGRVDPANIYLLSSTAPRCRHSSEIICGMLDIVPEFHDILWIGSDCPEGVHQSCQAVLDLIMGVPENIEILIVVTHLEYSSDVPPLYCQKAFGTSPRFYRGEYGAGRLHRYSNEGMLQNQNSDLEIERVPSAMMLNKQGILKGTVNHTVSFFHETA